MSIKKMISIWFFVGCLLTIYGVLILIAGWSDGATPAGREVAMRSLHAQIWWGIALVVIGVGYLVRFHPRRQR